MSLCCFSFSRGSGRKKAKREICACGRRNPNKPHRPLPSASGRRTRQVTVGIPGKEYPSRAIKLVKVRKTYTTQPISRRSDHEVIEEQVDSFIDASNGCRGQEPQARKSIQCQTERSSHEVVKEQVNSLIDASDGCRGQESQARKSVQCQTETSEEDIMDVVAHGQRYNIYWVRLQVRYLSESSTWNITEGLFNRFNYWTSLDPGKVHQATVTIQGRIQCAAELTQRLREACRMRALQKGTMEKVAGSLVPAFPAGNIPHICTLMPIHPAFSRAQWFLEELLTRSCPPSIRSDAIKVFSTSWGKPPHNDLGDTPQEQLAMATASVIGTWPDQILHFGQLLRSPWFVLKQALVLHSLFTRHTVGLVRSLWVELEHLEPTEEQWEEPPPELNRAPKPEERPASGIEPSPGVIGLKPSGPPALIPMPTTEPVPSPATDYPRAATLKHLIWEEMLNILTFSPRLVAEQLTAMDVELFKKVLPQECLGPIWSQRAKPGKEHMASTVHATVTHFNLVATCVITTCLGEPSMMAWERAKVVEHWIKVAKECRSLRNFSSLHAILAALQSVSIHRLKKMWGKVTRKCAVTLKKLCKEDNFLNREQLIKPSRFATMMLCLRGSKKGLHKKCVPFLGEYLTLLKRMDAVKKNDLEVDKILEEIVVLQEATQKFKIQPDDQFRAWFSSLERLSENESFILSCQLEPQS